MRLATTFLIAAMFAVCSSVSANELANPGFEDPITDDGPPFVGFWEGFSGGAGAVAENSTEMPLSGSQSLKLSISNTPNSFAGVFQDVPNLSAGQLVNYSGWNKANFGVSAVEIRLEFRDSVADMEISRTPNFDSMPGVDYGMFSYDATVPAGADTARVVYAIQSFGGVADQTVFVDDVSFTVVPEPTSFVLTGIAGLAMLCLRQRRK